MSTPTVTLEYEVVGDPSLQRNEIVVAGQKIDLTKVGQYVRVTGPGPEDPATCERCLPWVGRVFKRDDPAVAPFKEDGLHERCRHFLVPVGMPGLDKGEKTGIEVLQGWIQAGDVGKIQRVFGKQKGKLIADEELPIEEIWREDGTVHSLKELGVDQPKAKAPKLGQPKQVEKKNAETTEKVVGQTEKLEEKVVQPVEPIKDVFVDEELKADLLAQGTTEEEALDMMFYMDREELEDLGVLPAPAVEYEKGPDDIDEATKFLKDNVPYDWKRFREELGTNGYTEAIEGLDSYKTAGYSDINRLLRGKNLVMQFEGEEGLADIEERTDTAETSAAQIDLAFTTDTAILKKNLVVYRGANTGSKLKYDDFEPGVEFMDRGFVSTSISQSQAESFADGHIVFEIRVREGQRAMNMENFGSLTEAELLLNRDSAFRVLDRYEKKAYGRFRKPVQLIVVELVE